MRMFSTLTAVLAATALCAQAASAQQARPNRPYRGLFGGGVAETEQSLTVSGALGGGYDDNILAEGSGIGGGTSVDPRVARKGRLLLANGSIDYSLNRDRFGMSASVGTSSRYYPTVEPHLASGHSGSLGMRLRIARRTSLGAQVSTIYQPFTLSGVFPSIFDTDLGAFPAITSPNLDLTTTTDRYLMNQGGVSLMQTLSRRTSLLFGYTRQQSESARYNFNYASDNAYGAYTFQVDSNLGLRFGYGYLKGRFDDGSREYTNHNLDIGVNYNKVLSFSRRTTFSFGTGSTAISDGNTTRFQATGNARLKHEIGRTWGASVAYDRGVNFIESLRQPVFTDAVTAQFGGLFNRRVEFSANAQASFGQLGFSSSRNNGFDTYYAGTALQYALTRHVSLGLNYAYYRYGFDTLFLLPQGVAQNVNRQSVRGSVNLWAPLFQRSRRGNATR